MIALLRLLLGLPPARKPEYRPAAARALWRNPGEVLAELHQGDRVALVAFTPAEARTFAAGLRVAADLADLPPADRPSPGRVRLPPHPSAN